MRHRTHPLARTALRLTIVPAVALATLLASAGPSAAYEQQVAAQARAIADRLAGAENRTLAVVDFTDLQGNVTELGRFLAEELSIGLAGLGEGFEVVDRTHLKAILQENKLSATGLIDPSTAREVGRIAGVGALITGTVTPLGESVRLAVKVLDTETARIVTSSTANIPKTEAIDTLLQREIVGREPGLVRTNGSPPPTSSKTTEKAGFVFRLRRCTLSGESLRCSLSVTNQQDDCQLSIFATYNRSRTTRAIDIYGDQYEAASVQLGSNRNHYYVIAVHGIPMSLDLSFRDVAPGISRLALLEISGEADSECRGSGRDTDFKAQFRDIPVYRE